MTVLQSSVIGEFKLLLKRNRKQNKQTINVFGERNFKTICSSVMRIFIKDQPHIKFVLVAKHKYS